MNFFSLTHKLIFLYILPGIFCRGPAVTVPYFKSSKEHVQIMRAKNFVIVLSWPSLSLSFTTTILFLFINWSRKKPKGTNFYHTMKNASFQQLHNYLILLTPDLLRKMHKFTRMINSSENVNLTSNHPNVWSEIKWPK